MEPQGFLRVIGNYEVAAGADRTTEVAHIHLGSLDLSADQTMPDSGVLVFSYAVANQPWGNELADAQGLSVEYQTGDPALEHHDAETVPIVFQRGEGIPQLDSTDGESLALEFDEGETYLEFYDELYGEPGSPGSVPGTWICGYPYQLQDDMQEQCAEMAKAASGIESEPSEWRLLLQLASEPAANMNWGDGGFLYYWIREADLVARDFSHVWCILQTM